MNYFLVRKKRSFFIVVTAISSKLSRIERLNQWTQLTATDLIDSRNEAANSKMQQA